MILKEIPGVVPEDTLFIHGNMASNIWWKPCVEILSKAARFQKWTGSIYLVEIPGFGEQPLLPNQKNLSFEDLAAWYGCEIENLKKGPVHLVGHSTGGLLAAVVGGLRPDLVRNSILLDPVGPSGLPRDDKVQNLFFQMQSDSTLLDRVLSFAVKDSEQLDSQLWYEIKKAAKLALERVGTDMIRMLMEVEVSEILAKSVSPTLVLFGSADEVLQSSVAQRLADLLPKGNFSWVEDCGHSMNLERPAQFAGILQKHLYNS